MFWHTDAVTPRRFTDGHTCRFYLEPGEWMVDPLCAPWAALWLWMGMCAIAWYCIGEGRRRPAMAPRDTA